jgi:hypothetical protein
MENYRLMPAKYSGFYLQFEDEIKIFSLRIKVWRYIPDTIVAGVFKRKSCPTYLPYTTSHCYFLFRTKAEAQDWIKANPTLEAHFNKLLKRKAETEEVCYFIPEKKEGVRCEIRCSDHDSNILRLTAENKKLKEENELLQARVEFLRLPLYGEAEHKPSICPGPNTNGKIDKGAFSDNSGYVPYEIWKLVEKNGKRITDEKVVDAKYTKPEETIKEYVDRLISESEYIRKVLDGCNAPKTVRLPHIATMLTPDGKEEVVLSDALKMALRKLTGEYLEAKERYFPGVPEGMEQFEKSGTSQLRDIGVYRTGHKPEYVFHCDDLILTVFGFDAFVHSPNGTNFGKDRDYDLFLKTKPKKK